MEMLMLTLWKKETIINNDNIDINGEDDNDNEDDDNNNDAADNDNNATLFMTMMAMIMTVMMLTAALGRFGSFEITHFRPMSFWEGVVVLKLLILDYFYFGKVSMPAVMA